MHENTTSPPVEDEVKVIQLVRNEEAAQANDAVEKSAKERPPAIPQASVFDARREIVGIHVSDAMMRYMADLVNATRIPASFGDDLPRWIEIGASPRASLALDKCSRTHAWLNGRDYVDPMDVRAIVADVMRHRLGLSYEAQGEGVTPDHIVEEIVRQVALT
ncbi:MAG: AAA family ATPase [Arenibacterium sp.]